MALGAFGGWFRVRVPCPFAALVAALGVLRLVSRYCRVQNDKKPRRIVSGRGFLGFGS